MNSFYGGRQGASIIIVKRYATIALMKEDFAKGAETTSEVGYGEYVIIDTINGLVWDAEIEEYVPYNKKNDPDNGKLFRRGIAIDNGFCGGEFVGQVVGPQGETPTLDVDKYFTEEEAKEKTEDYHDGDYGEGEYTVGNEGLISGKYNSSVRYSWVTLRDSDGNIYGCLLGMSFPYTVFEIAATRVSAYYAGPFIERTNGDAPFYYQYNISVPEGLRGDGVDEFNIVYTVAKKGASYHSGVPTTEANKIGVLTEDTPLFDPFQIYQDERYSFENGWGMIFKENTGSNYYVNLKECYKPYLRYKKHTYVQSAEGSWEYVSAGEIDFPYKVSLADDGKVTVHYGHGDEDLEQKIKWVNKLKSAYDTTDRSQLMFIQYNNGYETNADGSYKTDEYGNRIPVYEKIDGTFNGIFEIVVSDDSCLGKDPAAAQPYHLLILYSDADVRRKIKTEEKNGERVYKNAYFYSKFFGEYTDEWHDLGYVRGEQEGIRIVGNVTDSALLPADGPESTPTQSRQGWCYTVGPDGTAGYGERVLWSYDYDKGEWYPIGPIVADIDFSPSRNMNVVPDTSAPEEDEKLNDLAEEGYWFVTTPVLYAE